MSSNRKIKKEHPPGLDRRWPCRKIKLLLVDDEAAFVDTLANRLKKRNFEVSWTYSGEGALQLLKKVKYDVAVIDLQMETLDGIDVLQLFQKTAPDLPVIILTGHGSETSTQKSLSFGAFDYLLKPCEFEELLTKINSAYYIGKEPDD